MIPLTSVIKTTFIVTALLFLSGWAVEFLWNSYLIEFLDIQKIEYKQALALQIVCFLLFGRTSMFNTINLIEQTEREVDNSSKKE